MKNVLKTNTERYNNDQSDISVEQWLRDIVKLPEYIPNFIDNGFRNIGVVRECTNEILQQIGIKANGHRLEILMHSKRCEAHPVFSDDSDLKITDSEIRYFRESDHGIIAIFDSST